MQKWVAVKYWNRSEFNVQISQKKHQKGKIRPIRCNVPVKIAYTTMEEKKKKTKTQLKQFR